MTAFSNIEGQRAAKETILTSISKGARLVIGHWCGFIEKKGKSLEEGTTLHFQTRIGSFPSSAFNLESSSTHTPHRFPLSFFSRVWTNASEDTKKPFCFPMSFI
jgi:hypothetical protein